MKTAIKLVGRTLNLLFTAGLAVSVSAQEWPQWRGPARDGRAPAGTSLPDPLPAALKPVWRTEVGEGYSSPVIVDGRVHLMARPNEPGVGREVGLALDAATGKVLWSEGYEAPFKEHPAALSAGPGPKATCVVEGERVFGFGITEILSCWERKTGKLLWRHDFSKEFNPIWPETGASGSPIVVAGKLIAQIGTRDKGGLAAFDTATGERVWTMSGDGPSYASVELFTLAGARQLVSFTQQSLVGVDPGRGATLWSVPFKTGYNQNIVTPIPLGDTVVYTGVEEGIGAVRIKRGGGEGGGAFSAEPVWFSKKHGSYMSSPVLVGEYIYFLSEKQKGVFVCMNAATGEVAWESPGRMGEYASTIVVGDKLLITTEDATMRVALADPAAWRELAKYELADSQVWAHPAVVGNRIYVKDQKSVICLEW